MPVLPLVGSMITVSSLILPSRSAASIIARPMRSLTLHSGFKFSSLAGDRGHAALGDAAQLHQRRVADALGDVVVDAGNTRCGHDDPFRCFVDVNRPCTKDANGSP